MKPWLIVTGDFVKTGGMDRANYALARWLADRGDEVHLVAHRVDRKLLAMPNVTWHEARKTLNSYYLGRRAIDRLGREWGAKIAARGGRVIVNGGNCRFGDVNWVHYVHAAYEPQTAGGVARQLTAEWKRRAFLAEEAASLREAKVVIANSQRTKDDLVRHLNVGAAKIHVVYLAADLPARAIDRAAVREKLGWAKDTPVAVFIGAMSDRRKGFDKAFEAWQQLNWDVRLAVIGAGAEIPKWKERIARAGMGERIEFMGFRNDVPEILRAADVMVAPARYEPYGLSVHEALSSGIPAIASACSGVAERFPLELRDLLVHDVEDAGELARTLSRWHGERDRYAAVMMGVSQSLRNRSWDQSAEELIGAIEGSAVGCWKEEELCLTSHPISPKEKV